MADEKTGSFGAALWGSLVGAVVGGASVYAALQKPSPGHRFEPLDHANEDGAGPVMHGGKFDGTGHHGNGSVNVHYPDTVSEEQVQAILDRHKKRPLAQVTAALARVGASWAQWIDGEPGHSNFYWDGSTPDPAPARKGDAPPAQPPVKRKLRRLRGRRG